MGSAVQALAPLRLPLVKTVSGKGEDIKIKLKGGDLIINYTDETVYMTGNAEKVFEGEVEV